MSPGLLCNKYEISSVGSNTHYTVTGYDVTQDFRLVFRVTLENYSDNTFIVMLYHGSANSEKFAWIIYLDRISFYKTGSGAGVSSNNNHLIFVVAKCKKKITSASKRESTSEIIKHHKHFITGRCRSNRFD